MRAGAEARENIKSEVKGIGKGETKSIDISATEGIERAKARAEANTRGA